MQERIHIVLCIPRSHDLVAERLGWGIDPNCRSVKKQRTPMMANICGGSPNAATVRALLKGGADPALTDASGLTALDYARRKLAKLQARPRRIRKSPNLDENNQLQLNEEEQAELDDMRMYFDLARRLGLLHAQMARGPIRKVSLNCRGEIAMRNTQLVTAAFVAGLMQFWVESVNIVNAETLARDRGIEIVESSSPRGGDFGSVLHSEVVTENKTYTAVGTLLGI